MARKKKKQRRDHYAEVLIPLAVAVPVIVAHDCYGFGSKKRCPEMAEEILKKLKEIEEGKTSMADVLQQLESLTGIRFE